MKITKEMIPLIEKALGFRLYDWQYGYLIGEFKQIPHERQVGRTTAYIVKLLLTNDKPIDIELDAMRYEDIHSDYYTHIFIKFMKEIDKKLNAVGLSTCTIKHDSSLKQGSSKIKGITIELGVTDKSVLKLRAIAKHTEALADELDRIDMLEYGETKINK